MKFGNAGDHGKHNTQISVERSSVKSPQLRPENVGAGKADPDGAISQSGVFFLFEMKIICLLVGAYVESSDDDLFAAHTFQNLSVRGKLLFLRGKIPAFQIEKLTSKKPDAPGIVFQGFLCLVNASDIGEDIYCGTVRGNVCLSFQFPQKALFRFFPALLFPKSFQSIPVRVKEDLACKPVHDGFRAVFYGGPKSLSHADHSRNIHAPGQNGGVRVDGTLYRYEGQYLFLIQGYRFTGRKVEGAEDALFLQRLSVGVLTQQIGDDPVGDIPYIRSARFQAGVIRAGKQFRETLRGLEHGVFRAVFFRRDHIPDGTVVSLVIQYHAVGFKNGGAGFVRFPQSCFINPGQLSGGGFFGLLKTADLLFGIVDADTPHPGSLFFQNRYFSNGDRAVNAFSRKLIHTAVPPNPVKLFTLLLKAAAAD